MSNSLPPNTRRPPIFLLKTPTTPRDLYDEYFRRHNDFPSSLSSSGSAEAHGFKPVFVPVLSHRFHELNLSILKSYFQSSQVAMTMATAGETSFIGDTLSKKKYGGMIFTSQRAVEAFGHCLANNIPIEAATAASKSMILYTVGPATTRLLTPLRDKYLPFATIYGEEAGNGENLARMILEHYNPRHNHSDGKGSDKPGLLFLVGDQRRDVIPRTLMDPALDEAQRIIVDELVVYETTEMAGFEDAFRGAVDAGERGYRDRSGDGQSDEEESMWVVIFSPTGCDAVLRTLGKLPSSTSVEGTKTVTKKKCLIATIGPTTCDYLRTKYAVEPDVVAKRPSPEGVGEAIRAYYQGEV
ncbi:tetrapyrrole biosynthesis, uroporphyrinogen III synthase [Talaromyces proteolyticus]|uniref:Tetrapyrrole biosynthesis, uroporphyrinogen III synthase n=1 Tax=Talaromyces proteolyticus TaxID=1131652 RepID=A0AAD4PYN8_9EURO|nr:tetrapyrrole biosynthesis, uroporphyrinogen III synthase [Talaromyces proteolyticus]KAH8701720.1 tetrapyrrole biosynthesis, uroporphyrinogen III synthase [Talaromyces proteolyticus]